MHTRLFSLGLCPLLLCVVAAPLVGCPSSTKHSLDAGRGQTSSGAKDASQASDASCELIATPGGLVPRACVHEVPNGATVSIGDAGTTLVSVGGSVVARYPACPCPHGGTGLPVADAATAANTGDADAGARNPACPAQAPADQAACTPVEPLPLGCEYGGDALGRCSTLADCASNGSADFHWYVSKAPGCANTNECPARFAAVTAGAACPSTLQTPCDYPEGRCGCLPCAQPDGGMGSIWSCVAASDSSGCPKGPVPRIGDRCDTPDQLCTRGAFCGIMLRPAMACRSGFWVINPQNVACGLRQCSTK